MCESATESLRGAYLASGSHRWLSPSEPERQLLELKPSVGCLLTHIRIQLAYFHFLFLAGCLALFCQLQPAQSDRSDWSGLDWLGLDRIRHRTEACFESGELVVVVVA